VLVPRTSAAGGAKTGRRRRERRREWAGGVSLAMSTMRYNPDRHHRVTVRLPKHRYTQGTYFVTICSFNRQHLFSTVYDGSVILTDLGCIVDAEWRRLQSTRSFVRLDTYVIMPDHVHAIIELYPHHKSPRAEPEEPNWIATRRFAQPASQSLQSLIGQFKSRVTKQVHVLRRRSGISVWQPGFYDHIVRDQYDLNRIRRYISDNPIRWQQQNPS